MVAKQRRKGTPQGSASQATSNGSKARSKPVRSPKPPTRRSERIAKVVSGKTGEVEDAGVDAMPDEDEDEHQASRLSTLSSLTPSPDVSPRLPARPLGTAADHSASFEDNVPQAIQTSVPMTVNASLVLSVPQLNQPSVETRAQTGTPSLSGQPSAVNQDTLTAGTAPDDYHVSEEKQAEDHSISDSDSDTFISPANATYYLGPTHDYRDLHAGTPPGPPSQPVTPLMDSVPAALQTRAVSFGSAPVEGAVLVWVGLDLGWSELSEAFVLASPSGHPHSSCDLWQALEGTPAGVRFGRRVRAIQEEVIVATSRHPLSTDDPRFRQGAGFRALGSLEDLLRGDIMDVILPAKEDQVVTTMLQDYFDSSSGKVYVMYLLLEAKRRTAVEYTIKGEDDHVVTLKDPRALPKSDDAENAPTNGLTSEALSYLSQAYPILWKDAQRLLDPLATYGSGYRRYHQVRLFQAFCAHLGFRPNSEDQRDVVCGGVDFHYKGLVEWCGLRSDSVAGEKGSGGSLLNRLSFGRLVDGTLLTLQGRERLEGEERRFCSMLEALTRVPVLAVNEDVMEGPSTSNGDMQGGVHTLSRAAISEALRQKLTPLQSRLRQVKKSAKGGMDD
ncbi:hypothetical protein SISNIDRAFT_233895 [Sistotremastrum niveocremeum HHB9708]|uniref:Uncharacterized protein n=1 Tax=Sistotremastrum niveocremeum HHB9708 TaxID=1314777 RepID=A0A164PUR2_9AGAM|nr:hypothetical protein SISNIDRAFT_233895 [Sistotremastrum niveocremeum HHB9708]